VGGPPSGRRLFWGIRGEGAAPTGLRYFVGGPTSGRRLLGHSRRGRRSHRVTSRGRGVVWILWEARPRAEGCSDAFAARAPLPQGHQPGSGGCLDFVGGPPSGRRLFWGIRGEGAAPTGSPAGVGGVSGFCGRPALGPKAVLGHSRRSYKNKLAGGVIASWPTQPPPRARRLCRRRRQICCICQEWRPSGRRCAGWRPCILFVPENWRRPRNCRSGRRPR